MALRHGIRQLPFEYGLFVHFADQDVKLQQVVTRSKALDLEETQQQVQRHFDLAAQQRVRLLPHGRFYCALTGTGLLEPCKPGSVLSPEAVLLVPVHLEGALYGVMVFGCPRRGFTLEAGTLDVLTASRDRIMHAAERTGHLEKLAESREETLRTLGVALEYRDYETKGHTDRVVELARTLGLHLGLSEEDLESLRWGAYLHDTGKIAIPDHILLKPGRLTHEEFEQVKKHSEIGFEMLKSIPNLPIDVLDVVLHHHERWDGTGYPSRCAGEDIPLLARIFTVVDVYDALVSRRPYKEAFSHEAAMQEILRGSGSQFDPRVVQALVDLHVGVSP